MFLKKNVIKNNINHMNKTIELSHEVAGNKVKATLGKHILADGFDFVMDYEKSHGIVRSAMKQNEVA